MGCGEDRVACRCVCYASGLQGVCVCHCVSITPALSHSYAAQYFPINPESVLS